MQTLRRSKFLIEWRMTGHIRSLSYYGCVFFQLSYLITTLTSVLMDNICPCFFVDLLFFNNREEMREHFSVGSGSFLAQTPFLWIKKKKGYLRTHLSKKIIIKSSIKTLFLLHTRSLERSDYYSKNLSILNYHHTEI